MNVAIIVAVIAGLVSVAGWPVNHILSSRADLKRQRLVSRLAHVERQLEQLYGPLAFLIIEGRASFGDLLSTLGRNYVFREGERLSEEALSLWLFWVDNDLIPRNTAIQALLSSKAHLIVGDDMPESYIKFLDHHNSWRVTHLRWKQEGVKYSWHSKVNWPGDFDSDVMSAFQGLRAEHARLIGLIGQV